MRKTVSRIITTALLAAGLLAGGITANAATISMVPAEQTVADGATFSVDIMATGLPATTGGALDITWTAADMTLNSILLATTDPIDNGSQFPGPWDPVSSFFTGVDAAGPGFISGLFVGSFGSVSGDAPVARLIFTLGTGVTNSVINLSEAALGGTWSDLSGGPIANNYFGATINPAAVVPVPAAVWLFGSGLLGLVGVARRRG